MVIPIIVGVLFIGLFILYIYNDLVSSRLRIKEAWSQIDVQVKRRADLIPNLVETVKAYAKHEQSVLSAVTAARSALLAAKTPGDTAQAYQEVTATVQSLLAVSENYPQLKANESFLQLQRELSDTEDKVAYARQFYNSAVYDYSRKREMFPGSVLVRQFSFPPEDFFVANDEERKAMRITMQ